MSLLIIFKPLNSDLVYRYKYKYSVDKIDELRKQIDADLSSIIRDIDKIINKMSLKKDLLKYKPRKEQQDALDFIDGEYKRNPMNKFFL
jgi:hypothetical protein